VDEKSWQRNAFLITLGFQEKSLCESSHDGCRRISGHRTQLQEGYMFLGGFLWCLYEWKAYMSAIVGAYVIMTTLLNLHRNRYLRQIAAKRLNEDIGTFARSFDRRNEPFDPWVVRATWDALQPYVTFRDGRLPLRPTDHLADDLSIADEDLEDIIADKVAHRSGRSLDSLESNPYFGKVATVGDFVRFMSSQPRSGDTNGA
jgi:hypothetical protein